MSTLTSNENALVEGEKFTTAWLNIDKFPGGMMMSSHGGRFGPVPAMTGCLITTSAITVEEWRLKGVAVIEVQLRNAPETCEPLRPPQRYRVQQDKGEYALKGCADGDLVDYGAYEALLRRFNQPHELKANVVVVGPTCGKDTPDGPCRSDIGHEGDCDGLPY